MSALLLATAVGVLAVGGVWLLVMARLPSHPRLGDALDLLEGGLGTAAAPEPSGWPERVARSFPRMVSAETRRRLQLQGTSVERFLARKFVLGLAGLAAPTLVGAVLLVGFGAGIMTPLALAVILGGVGFVLPDLLLRRASADLGADATEALLTFCDLVVLERLANRSATQALSAAAELSDSGVFVAVRDGLERARLEQRPPFAELKRLSERLDLPALADIADVMQLDESGAALSGALRARVKELRDAHLTREKIRAAAISEQLTLYMVIPSLVFGLVFLCPPLLRLIAAG